MNGNRVPWMISVVAVIATVVVALVAWLVALSPRVAAQDPVPDIPVVALPVEGELVAEPAMVDPAAVDAAVSPAFTYQGVLRSGSAPADGAFDFQFQLFNAATGGTQRGPTLLADNTNVAQGRFTTILNFGNIFGNEALWIAVGVRSGASTSAFTMLAPRQALTAVPFARFAVSAVNASAQEAKISTLQSQLNTMQSDIDVQQSEIDTLRTETNTLKTQVAALQSLLTGVSSANGGATLLVSGRNLQIVSGSGTTDGPINGRGNIIVGYNEPNFIEDFKTGSHNVIVGKSNSYGSYGGIIAGQSNWSDGPAASILGGTHNSTRSFAATVTGGNNNSAEGDFSTVSGGFSNRAIGFYSAVSGGRDNEAIGSTSVVSSGVANIVTGTYSSITGGYNPPRALSESSRLASSDYCSLDAFPCPP